MLHTVLWSIERMKICMNLLNQHLTLIVITLIALIYKFIFYLVFKLRIKLFKYELNWQRPRKVPNKLT